MTTFDASTSGADVVAAFPDAVKGKTFAITGPSEKGLGAQTAIHLAAGKPATILLLGRTESKALSVIAQINTISPTTTVHFIPLDLTLFTSIRTCATTISTLVSKIDVLINNAGIMGVPTYTLTSENLESHFGSNHIGHFLLTSLLLPLILASGPGSRIINLSSKGYLVGGVRFDDYNFSAGETYNCWSAYAQSKTANILFTTSLGEKLKARGVGAFAVNPGVISTNLSANVERSDWAVLFKMFSDQGHAAEFGGVRKDLAQGTACTLVAALDLSLADQSGVYLSDCTVESTLDYAHDPALAEKLWVLSEDIVGQKFTI